MNGFASASRPRTLFRLLSSFACLVLLAGVIPLQAAAPGQRAFTKSTIPLGSHAVHPALATGGWAQMQEIIESDPGPDPEFGSSVAVHGTTAMIGAKQAKIDGNDAQGAVYVFHQDPDGTWIQTQKIVSNDGQPYDTFGNAVVFSDDTAFIGAYGSMINGNFSQGAVYVFKLVNGTWTQTQKITAPDGQMFDNFGYSIALSGTTAIIGADGASVGDNGTQGAAYVYDGSGGTWTNTHKLTASDGGPGDIFAYSIAFDGTHALFGAYMYNQGQGAVYAFEKSGGSWTQTQKLVASDAATNTYFGYATALSGSTLLIGSWGANPGGNDTQGSAYIFTLSNGMWTQTQELVASDGAPFGNFGHSVALQGTTALIGSDGWNDTRGAVYVFDGSSGAFVQTQQFAASDAAPAFQFGFPVALDGDTAVVGSWLWMTPDRSAMPGAAYFFGFNTTPPPTYTIGGTVSGLAGNGLVLQQGGGDSLAVSADGTFTFATPLNRGAQYAVTVFAQPRDPAQTCVVTNGDGTVGAANVDTVTVTCTTDIVDPIFADGFDGTVTMSQTSDSTPIGPNSAACPGDADGTTAANQYWRRFYFSDYAVTTPTNVTDVDVAIEQTVGAPEMTVTLYTIPHSVTVDTIDIGQLTQIGQTIVPSPADATLTSVNVPVTGAIADTVGNDLVVEVSTEDGSADGTAFIVGSTTSPETHPSFVSAAACGSTNPTPTANIGFPDMHIIQTVHVTR
ncbi:MAG TPA: FG-GAP repeat protein [Rudaea sp.]